MCPFPVITLILPFLFTVGLLVSDRLPGQSIQPSIPSQKEEMLTLQELSESPEVPITFHGVVQDQEGRPVAGAKVTYRWPKISNLRPPQTCFSQAPDGRFVISGGTASDLSILVQPPEGYQAIDEPHGFRSQKFRFVPLPSRIADNYALQGKAVPPPFKSDPLHPVVFKVEKIGPADAVLTGEKQIPLPKTGETRYFSVARKAPRFGEAKDPEDFSIGFKLTVNEADFIVPTKKRTYRKQYPWSLQVTVPGGGIRLVGRGESRQQAPEDGYSDSVDFTFPKDMDETWWTDGIRGSLFVKFANGSYARVDLSGALPYFEMRSVYNPTGSRNLRLDPSKDIPISEYFSYQGDPKKAPDGLRYLAVIKIDQLNIPEQPLGEAMAALDLALESKRPGSSVKPVIRFADANANEQAALRSSLTTEQISYAVALDKLCTKAGVRWSVEGRAEQGRPLIVISKK